jgi:DNA-binding GntR family transcriptional regulator
VWQQAILTLTCVYTDPYAARGLRSDHAYAELKRGLLLGEFPINVRLGEERLAALIGVSRTPIREAMMRLHAEGLVRRATDGGYLPVVPDVVLMRHLYEVRIGLELQALHRPARNDTTHDLGLLEVLRDEWRSLQGDEPIDADPAFVMLDESFHVTLAEAAGNPVLADHLRQVNDRIRIVRMQDFLTSGRIDETIAEHLGIVEAVLAGDLTDAERRFAVHIGQSIAVVEQRVSAAIARMAEQP